MKAFKIALLIPALLITFTIKAQSWQWYAPITNTSSNITEAGEVVSDPLGNTYSTGYFSNTLIAGSGFSITSNGGSDIYIIKRGPNGQTLWAKRFGGAGDDNGTGITIDKHGDVIFCGKISQTVVMGTSTLTSNGGYDVFIAKIDNNGNPLWARSFGGTSSGIWEAANDVATDTLNNIYVTGFFFASVTLNAGVTISSTGPNPDMFALKMDAAGSYAWAKSGGSYSGGFDYDEGVTIKVSPDQNSVVVGGTFRGLKFAFGTDTLINTSNTFTDSYIIALNAASGSRNYINAIKGANYTEIADLALDATGNIYATGYCESNLFSEPPTITVSAGQYAIFLFKYSNAGNFLWSTGIGNSTYGHESTSILINHHNKIVVEGYYNNYVQSGTLSVNGTGMFLATLDTNKTTIGIVKATNSLGTYITARSMSIDTADNIYVHGATPYGANVFGAITYTTANNELFNAKYGFHTNIPTALPVIVNDRQVSIYPNPASDLIEFRTSQEIDHVDIYSVTGEKTISIQFDPVNHFRLTTIGLAQGMYTVLLYKTGGKKIQDKFIINR
jgi:hypothetical protein